MTARQIDKIPLFFTINIVVWNLHCKDKEPIPYSQAVDHRRTVDEAALAKPPVPAAEPAQAANEPTAQPPLSTKTKYRSHDVLFASPIEDLIQTPPSDTLQQIKTPLGATFLAPRNLSLKYEVYTQPRTPSRPWEITIHKYQCDGVVLNFSVLPGVTVKEYIKAAYPFNPFFDGIAYVDKVRRITRPLPGYRIDFLSIGESTTIVMDSKQGVIIFSGFLADPDAPNVVYRSHYTYADVKKILYSLKLDESF